MYSFFFFFFYPLRNFCREDCRRRCYAWKSDLFCSPRLCSDTPVKKKRRTWQQKDTIKKGQKKKKETKKPSRSILAALPRDSRQQRGRQANRRSATEPMHVRQSSSVRAGGRHAGPTLLPRERTERVRGGSGEVAQTGALVRATTPPRSPTQTSRRLPVTRAVTDLPPARRRAEEKGRRKKIK